MGVSGQRYTPAALYPQGKKIYVLFSYSVNCSNKGLKMLFAMLQECLLLAHALNEGSFY
jgi:hypothetical protein